MKHKNTTTKYPIILSEDKDYAILKFLWRWKVMSTSGLSLYLANNPKSKAVYKRLWRLEKNKYIETRCDGGNKFLWELSAKGFNAIRKFLPEDLKEVGYKSEKMGHDFLSAVFQMNEWMYGTQKDIEFCTEQELRRYNYEDLPVWVPNRYLSHRADGYTKINYGEIKRVIAIEVELTHQKHDKYFDVARFYYDHKSKVNDVLWLVTSPAMISSIQKEISSFDSNELCKHYFVLCDNFLHDFDDALVLDFQNNKVTLGEFVGKTQETGRNMVSCQYALNLRKAPQKSRTCKLYKIGDFSVRV